MTTTEMGIDKLSDRAALALPAIVDEVAAALKSINPDYAGFVEQQRSLVIAAGEPFVRGAVEAAAARRSMVPGNSAQQHRELFEQIGRAQRQAGADLKDLMAAYRLGAQVAWDHLSSAMVSANADSGLVAALGLDMFAAIDRFSEDSLRGYHEEEQRGLAELDRFRTELAELLLSERSASATVANAARRAGWTLPSALRAVLLDDEYSGADAALRRLGSDCLRVRRGHVLAGILPDPSGSGQRERLRRSLAGTGAVIGMSVAPSMLPRTVQLAAVARRLQRDGLLTDDPLFVEEHVDALIVHRDEALLAALADRHLAPMAELPETTRERLLETLGSYLRQFGDRSAMAAELHLHPNTVRYRMHQLQDLLGTALEDPSVRSALMLTLAWGPPVKHRGESVQ